MSLAIGFLPGTSLEPTVTIIIIIIIITTTTIGKDTISFMHGIYTSILETNHVPKEYNVAAILSLLFMAPISLAPAFALMYFYISTFQSMCALPNMAVFCSSLNYYYYHHHPTLVFSMCTCIILQVSTY
jgi:hypothetical protein